MAQVSTERAARTRFRRHRGALGAVERTLLISIPCVGAIFLLHAFEYLNVLFWLEQYLAIFLGLTLVIVFLTKPATQKATWDRLPWYDAVLSVLSAVVCGYLVIFWPEISLTMSFITQTRVILGAISVILVLEATRRLFGWVIVGIIVFFIFYALFTDLFPGPFYGRPLPLPRLIVSLYLDNGGLLGITLNVGATVVLAFVLFGRLLFTTGGGQWLINLALALLGRFSGGAAKSTVVASGLFGSISGIALANVAVTGTVTIPMMKRHGIDAHDAAAIEAAASTGGIILPPIMGVVAFIMAAYLETTYGLICIAAVVPALLYYFCTFNQVHFFSLKRGFEPMSREEIPSLKETMKDGWIFSIPIFVLIYTLFVMWLDASSCGIYASIAVVPACMLKKQTRLNFHKLGAALETAAEGILEIGIICAAAGLIVGVVLFTGVGGSFALALTELCGGNLFILLILAAVASIILGMGMPIVTVYIIVVILVAPALTTMGVSPLAAHLFVIYFGCISFLTPPVCLSVYAAAALANSDIWKTAWRAIRLGTAAYIIPFVFVFDNRLLLIGSPGAIMISIAAAFTGVAMLTIGIEGYLLRNLGVGKRVLFIIAGLALLITNDQIKLGGLCMGISLLFWEWVKLKPRLQSGQA